MNRVNQIVGAVTGPLVALILALLLLCAILVAIRMFRRRSAKAPRLASEHSCSRCGYDLSHSALPRCPECGALAGFGKSAQELNIEREIDWKDPQRGD